MEKRSPHCALHVAQALVAAGKVRATFVALNGAAALGLEEADIFAVVLALTMADFYKSMTTYADHRIWQDVYRPITRVGPIYLKLTVVVDVLVVSFKEL